MISISYIIPAYNNLDLLERCLGSLMPQVEEADQVIVIDDGSPDDTIYEYLKREYGDDERLLPLYQKNQGSGPARNYGLDHAESDYIWFIDSDDMIEQEASRKVKKILKEKDPDLLFFDYYLKRFGSLNERVRLNLKCMDDYEFMFTDSFPWNKLIRAELLEGIRFPDEKIRFQDHATIPKLISKAADIQYVPEAFYIYDLGHGANISKNDKKYNDMYIVCDHLVDYFRKDDYGHLVFLLLNTFLFNRIYSTRDVSMKDRYSEYKQIKNYLDSHIPGWRKTEYVTFQFWKKYKHLMRFMFIKVSIVKLFSQSPLFALILLHPFNATKTMIKKVID